MKNQKVFLCVILLLAVLLVPLAGCSKENAPSGEETSVSPSAEPNNNTSDASFSYGEGLDANGFWEGVRALDYVELFDYRALPIPSDVHQITDDDVTNELTNLIANYSPSEQITDRAVVDGDLVNIDYVGSVNGIPFDGGSTEGSGTDVTAGSTDYIDDFLDQIIGHMPGETIDVEVTFPDDYGEASLQGKDAVFVTTINFIREETEAELTDETVDAYLSLDYGWTTVDEAREGMRSNLLKYALQQYVHEYFATQVTVKSVPDQMIAYQEQSMVSYYQETSAYYDMDLEEFLMNSEGVSSVEELIELNREQNVTMATVNLVTQAIAEDAGIQIGDDDLTAYFSEYFGSGDYSSFEEQYGLPYIKQVVLGDKILNFVIDNAVLL